MLGVPIDLIQPRRRIMGMSAILLPYEQEGGPVDWRGFERHLIRTAQAGLIPAVNMDTGYINLLDESTRRGVLDRTVSLMAGQPFVAGAFVADTPHDSCNMEAYFARMDEIASRGGTPVIFPSYGLTRQSGPDIVAFHEVMGRRFDQFIAFELGTVFAPFGGIFDLETYEGILNVKSCIGAKHSSLSRHQEWDRIRLRNRVRPEFKVLTGNDLAIDMVMYGSDYLLGLSTFAPDVFAERDKYWEQGDNRFYERNDLLQYLGFFAFRAPVPAYKHSAAQFLKIREQIGCDATHPRSPRRPDADLDVLQDIAVRMGVAH